MLIKNKIFIIIKNILFIKKLFFFLDKSKIYIYNSYLIDDYRPENKSDKTIFTHLQEQIISETAMKSALKSNIKLVNDIKKNIFFHNLIKKYSDKRIIIAANKLLFFQHYDQCRLSVIKKKIKKNNKFFFIFEKKENFILHNFLKTIFLMLKFLLQNINYKSLLFKKKNLIFYDFAFHINNPKEVLNNDEENKIYFKNNKRKKILLLESQWGLFSPEIKKKIKKNNLDYTNDQKIDVTFSQLLYKIIPEFFYLLTLIFKQIIKLNMDKFFLAFVRVRLDILRLKIFFENYQIKNFISRDDFSSTHILRTIILEKKNCKHIGISHSNFLDPLTSIQNHFKCHSKYLVSSLLIKKLYENTWFNSKTINIGQFQAGKIIKHSKDKNLKKTIHNKFGKKKKIILLLLSSINSSNTFNSFEKNKENLINILNVLNFDKNYILFIKPRSRHRALEFISSFANYNKFKKRIFIIFDEFSTYELISHSKFLFAPAASSSIFEGMYNKELTILPINTNSIKNLVWSNFPKIRIFKNSNEVIEFFRNIKKKNYIKSYKKSFQPIEKIMCNNKKNPIDLIINNL